ncbi:MAG: hypothetical protein OXH72_00110 [Caldilineaceae bacterium]|nr:hypothetical protein [Caldilineaceae bacterium]
MNGSQTINTDILPSAFLDSNILVMLFQFWDTCTCANIRLDDVCDWKDLKDALKSAGAATDALNADDAKFVKSGMKSFQILHGASNSGYLFRSSRVCWSEVHHVFLEARGLERLIRLGVPHSLRVKRPQVLYRGSLQEVDYEQLDKDLETFRDELKMEYGIDVIDVEDLSAGLGVVPDSIWDIAKVVWSHVLIEVIDAYVYSASIRIEADVFVTSDGSLTDALKQLRNPDSDWIALVTSLRKELGVEPDIELPLPLSPTTDLPNNPRSS